MVFKLIGFSIIFFVKFKYFFEIKKKRILNHKMKNLLLDVNHVKLHNLLILI